MNKKAIFALLLALALFTLILLAARFMSADFNPFQNKGLVPNAAAECIRAGCSGELCVEASIADDIFTTCEYRPEYSCYQQAACTLLDNGECGFIQDEQLMECLRLASESAGYSM